MQDLNDFNFKEPKRLAVKLTNKGENYVTKGHPWIFSNSIQKINKEPDTGDLAIIFKKSDNKFMGFGLFDADSDIRIKMLYHGVKSQKVDVNFFESRLMDAFSRRQPLLKTDTNSFRLVYGESDGFPGLIADAYDRVLVIKLYSAIWFPYLNDLLQALIQISKAETVVLRLSRKLQTKRNHPFKDGSILYGELSDEIIPFKEHGVNFSANVIRGHKTGYFLDHRYNRKTVGELSNAKTVLDVFSYAGGFSVHALVNGAASVTSLDISAQAIEVAKYNANLNVYRGTHQVIVGDAFKELRLLTEMAKTFDVVIIDPPSFAKQQSEVGLAKKKYHQLAELGAKLTRPKGTLVLASCSSRVSKADFVAISLNAVEQTGRKFQLFKTTDHDVDHPIGFPEAAYLKTIYLKMDS